MHVNAEVSLQRKAGHFASNVNTYYSKVSVLYLDSDIEGNNEKIQLFSFKETFQIHR